MSQHEIHEPACTAESHESHIGSINEPTLHQEVHGALHHGHPVVRLPDLARVLFRLVLLTVIVTGHQNYKAGIRQRLRGKRGRVWVVGDEKALSGHIHDDQWIRPTRYISHGFNKKTRT